MRLKTWPGGLHKTIDCDFLLSFHSPAWPTSAREWRTRIRAWPDQDAVNTVVAGGCELVPKIGLNNDQFRWRLSFSRAEGFLASQVGPKQRICYLALKMFFKQKLKNVCSFLKSYHLKTLFFYFLERKSAEYWKTTSEDAVLKHLLEMVSGALQVKTCPHYFIHHVNLWETAYLAEYVQFRKQCILGIKCVNKAIGKKKQIDLFLPVKVQTQLLIDKQYRVRKRGFWWMFILILGWSILCNLISSLVFIILLVMLLQAVIVWLIGSVCCSPLIAIFLVLFYLVKKTC